MVPPWYSTTPRCFLVYPSSSLSQPFDTITPSSLSIMTFLRENFLILPPPKSTRWHYLFSDAPPAPLSSPPYHSWAALPLRPTLWSPLPLFSPPSSMTSSHTSFLVPPNTLLPHSPRLCSCCSLCPKWLCMTPSSGLTSNVSSSEGPSLTTQSKITPLTRPLILIYVSSLYLLLFNIILDVCLFVYGTLPPPLTAITSPYKIVPTCVGAPYVFVEWMGDFHAQEQVNIYFFSLHGKISSLLFHGILIRRLKKVIDNWAELWELC